MKKKVAISVLLIASTIAIGRILTVPPESASSAEEIRHLNKLLQLMQNGVMWQCKMC